MVVRGALSGRRWRDAALRQLCADAVCRAGGYVSGKAAANDLGLWSLTVGEAMKVVNPSQSVILCESRGDYLTGIGSGGEVRGGSLEDAIIYTSAEAAELGA